MKRDLPSDLQLDERYTRVVSGEMSAASAVIERLQGPFRALNRTPEAVGPVCIRAALCCSVSVSTFAFGRAVDIVPSGLADALLVTTAIRGSIAIASGGRLLEVGVGDRLITQAEDAPMFVYGADTEVLKLRFERRRLEQLSGSAHGEPGGGRLHFQAEMPGAGASWRWMALVHYLVATLNDTDGAPVSAPEMASLEEHLMLTLLNIQPHTWQGAPQPGRRGTAPRQFRAAADYIERHLRDTLTLADIADAAHCSVRSLARAFAGAAEGSPMQYVHTLRLARIRAELQNTASAHKTIAEIAMGWGCGHIGEFNRSYLLAFDETPSVTRKERAPSQSGTNPSSRRQVSVRRGGGAAVRY
ncbi:AraC family transcriptional regulator [Janthinobacterium sp. HLX7-2]|uniref:helix-turn-helix transcriptional regulator n=1 Tax=Janthinobacterium sp. HLX7-2 TaxID=1259331 RepID=UPI003F26E468